MSIFLVLALLVTAEGCNFPAIFNFGDSNSDTGASSIIYNNVHWPNGKSVGKVFKRYSDGYLMIDLMAEKLGLPLLNASVDTNGTSFVHGVNYAVAGQRINRAPGAINDTISWAYYFDVQVSEFLSLKQRVLAGNGSIIEPKAEDFADALYTIDIGQNDIPINAGMEPLSSVLDDFSYSVRRLLGNGAKYLWVHNTGPYGCLPNAISSCGKDKFGCSRDKFGCIEELNQRAQDFNVLLTQSLTHIKKEYTSAVITLVDMYAAKYSLITCPSSSTGFNDDLRFQFCCGNANLFCAIRNEYSCDNPSDYVSWDGIHFTQAANQYLANAITGGQYSERALIDACVQ